MTNKNCWNCDYSSLSNCGDSYCGLENRPTEIFDDTVCDAYNDSLYKDKKVVNFRNVANKKWIETPTETFEGGDNQLKMTDKELADVYYPEPTKEEMTCYKCESNKTCEHAWDSYNTHGDCLGIK